MARTVMSRIAALALVAGVAGCGVLPLTGEGRSTSPATSAAPAPEAPSGAASGGPAVQPGSAMRFDEDYCEWANGVVVNASTPIRFRPSAQAVPAAGVGTPMWVTLLVVNHSGAPYDLTAFSATLLSGGRPATQIVDPLNRLQGVPGAATVANGAELEVPLGFWVADPDDIVLEVAPGRDYDCAYFTS